MARKKLKQMDPEDFFDTLYVAVAKEYGVRGDSTKEELAQVRRQMEADAEKEGVRLTDMSSYLEFMLEEVRHQEAHSKLRKVTQVREEEEEDEGEGEEEDEGEEEEFQVMDPDEFFDRGALETALDFGLKSDSSDEKLADIQRRMEERAADEGVELTAMDSYLRFLKEVIRDYEERFADEDEDEDDDED